MTHAEKEELRQEFIEMAMDYQQQIYDLLTLLPTRGGVLGHTRLKAIEQKEIEK